MIGEELCGRTHPAGIYGIQAFLKKFYIPHKLAFAFCQHVCKQSVRESIRVLPFPLGCLPQFFLGFRLQYDCHDLRDCIESPKASP